MICSICLDEFFDSSNNKKNNIKMKCCKNYLHAECLARLIYCDHITCPYCRDEIILKNYFTDDSFDLVNNNLYEYNYNINNLNDTNSVSFFAHRHIYLLTIFNLMCEYLLFLRTKNKILYNLSYTEYKFCGIKKNIPSLKRFLKLISVSIIIKIHYILLFIFIILLCNSAITYSINNPRRNYNTNYPNNYMYYQTRN